MPHLHMEYTANLPELNADVALIRLNNTLVGPVSSRPSSTSRAAR